MAFLKALSLVLFSSFFTQLHLATSFLSHQSITNSMLMTLSSSFLFSPNNFQQNIQLLQNTISEISSWMASNFLSLNSSKTEFLLIGLPTQLDKIDNPSLSMPSSTSIKLVASARNLGVIFDSNLSFSDHISYISKTCFAHIRDLRRIRNTLDHTTACTIATSLIHSKLDYCNSLFLNLNCQQTERLQLILNSTARAVTKTPKYNHINLHLKSLHWLKITQRIQYKIISLTYKSLQFKQPSSILDLLKIQPTHSTRSSAGVTLQRPSNPSRLKITDRSFFGTRLGLIYTSFTLHFIFHSSAHHSSRTYFFIHDVLSVPERAGRNPFLSALWCTLNLPHSLTLLISPHSITCFVNHTSTIVFY